MDVVTEYDRCLIPRFRDRLFVTGGTHNERRMDLPLFAPGTTRCIKQERCTRDGDRAQNVHAQFRGLRIAEVVDLRQQEPVADADHAESDRNEKCRSFR